MTTYRPVADRLRTGLHIQTTSVQFRGWPSTANGSAVCSALLTAALAAKSLGDIVPTMKFVQNYGTALAIAIMALAIGLGTLEPAAALLGRIVRGVAAIGLLTLAGAIFWQQRRNVRRSNTPR
jgi:hypothetical protein